MEIHDRRDAETQFVFRNVIESEKDQLVDRVFKSVAENYDLMNDLMSLGVHRVWKRLAVLHLGVRHNSSVLDVACGTADLSLAIAKKLGPSGRLVLTDINSSMLRLGRNRMLDHGHLARFSYVQSDAENLAFAESSFDRVIISFGLRNVTRINQALESMYQVMRPGSRLLVLEFSKPVIPLLEKIYHQYSFRVIPTIGKIVARDRDSYQYLVESIRQHPDQETLADMMAQAGFERVEYFNLTGGIVAMHVAWKL